MPSCFGLEFQSAIAAIVSYWATAMADGKCKRQSDPSDHSKAKSKVSFLLGLVQGVWIPSDVEVVLCGISTPVMFVGL